MDIANYRILYSGQLEIRLSV